MLSAKVLNEIQAIAANKKILNFLPNQAHLVLKRKLKRMIFCFA